MNVLEEKSENFADRIILMSDYYIKKDSKYSLLVIMKQLTRSGTSIGANIAESTFAQSKSDLRNKLSIALKEANETRFWLRRLSKHKYMEKTAFESMLEDVNELISMLVASIKTLNSNKEDSLEILKSEN